jgi:colicin import membrane protein
VTRIRYATAADDAEDVPDEQRCIWPGCTRRRAVGRASGSGRQREYCEKADRPEAGGPGASEGCEHNARNRWALRNQEPRDTSLRDAAADGSGGGAGAVLDAMPLTYGKLHASELLEQARRQHAAALAALAAERETYALLGEQLRVLADPATLDLEIASVTLKAGREISQAAEDAARARQAQLTAQREREEALAGRLEAERALAERTAELNQERDVLIRESLEAALRAGRAEEQATEALAAAGTARRASEQASRDAGAAKTEAARQVAAASARADAAAVRADEAVRAAQERADAERERADAQAERAARQAAAAQAAAEAARGDAEAARRDAAQARAEASELRSRLTEATTQLAAARAEAETARARLEDASRQHREDTERQRAERDRDLARLTAAHQEAIEAERARTRRAEAELDARRAVPAPADAAGEQAM